MAKRRLQELGHLVMVEYQQVTLAPVTQVALTTEAAMEVALARVMALTRRTTRQR